jgi:N-acetylneuraminic acid mutarotase
VYVFGGLTNERMFTSNVYRLNMASLAWSRLSVSGSVHPPVANHTAVLFDRDLVVFGGWCSESENKSENRCDSMLRCVCE